MAKKKNVYRVYVTISESTYYDVEAESKEKAEELVDEDDGSLEKNATGEFSEEVIRGATEKLK